MIESEIIDNNLNMYFLGGLDAQEYYFEGQNGVFLHHLKGRGYISPGRASSTRAVRKF